MSTVARIRLDAKRATAPAGREAEVRIVFPLVQRLEPPEDQASWTDLLTETLRDILLTGSWDGRRQAVIFGEERRAVSQLRG